MAINYMQYSFQLYGLLTQLRQHLAPMADDAQVADWIAQIDQQQRRLETCKFQVAVLGEFRRGKSSFINTLLGREILPADALPTTATINRVIYGDHPRATLKFKDGHEQAVAIDKLSDYVTKLTKDSSSQAARIEEAVVEYPSMFCRNEVELIDTPGLNDDEEMTHVTISRLKQIDLAIVAISADFPFSETETELVTQLLETPHISQIIFVVTMIDKVDEEDRDRLLEFLRKRIAEKVHQKLTDRHDEDDPVFEKYDHVFSHLRLYGLSAKYALKALKINDMQLFEQSGYHLFNQELPSILVKEQASGTIRSTLGVIQQIAYEASMWPQQRCAALQDMLDAITALKPALAQRLYGAIAQERQVLEHAVQPSLHHLKQHMDDQSTMFSIAWEHEKGSDFDLPFGVAWEHESGSDYDRAAAVMVLMAETFRSLNDFILNDYQTLLRDTICSESAKFRHGLAEECKALCASVPKAEAMITSLLESLQTPPALPVEPPYLQLFHWTKWPTMTDVITVQDTAPSKANAKHPYLLRVQNALHISSENCLEGNRKAVSELLDQLDQVNKLQMQDAVMKIFKFTGNLAGNIKAELEELSSSQGDQFIQHLTTECRKISESYEAELAAN